MTELPGRADMSDAFLQESLEELYEQGPCGYLLTNLNGTILHVNDTLLAWTGYDRDDLVETRRFQDLLTLPGRLFYENQYFPLLRLRGSVKEVAFDLRREDREPLPVFTNSILRTDADGRPMLIASAIFDATDRRSYEQELLRSQQRAEQLAAVVRMSSDAIVSMSADGIVETWNAGAQRLFGYPAQEMVGGDLRTILSSPDDETWRETMVELRQGRPVVRDLSGRCADGSTVDVSASFTPHTNLLGELGTVSVIMRDIAERRAVEQLQREFLAVTTHELRGPVTGITGNAQLMRRRGAYSDRSVDAIITQSERLERLIDDLLLASEIQADRLTLAMEATDLVGATRAAVSLLGIGQSRICIEAPDEPLLVSADPLRLGQVLTNLLTNAIKYAPGESEITVRVTAGTGEASVAVVDRGVGIPPESLPYVFDRFYRVTDTAGSAQGLGLGLYICRRIMEAHGGRIEADSRPGQGSTFTITLPRLSHPHD